MRERLINLKKIIDPWSVPHFLFGIVAALAAITFSWPVFPMFFIVLIIALLWELLEKRFRLSEAPGNAWMDVLLPLIAFAMTLPLVNDPTIDQSHRAGLLVVSILLYLVTNFLSWRARIAHDRDFLG